METPEIPNTPPPEYCSEEEDLDAESIATRDPEEDEPVVTIHPTARKDGVLVKVQPPIQPSDPEMDHVPCDIVLVIDVSSSMNEDAPAPAEEEGGGGENFGLTVLDLTKHAARTIVSTLNEGDRLGIVTFGYGAEIVQELVSMSTVHKKVVNSKIDNISANGQTNLWSGIKTGLELFQRGGAGARVPALMVLTDGQPNHMCPQQGYVKRLHSLCPLPAIINTFGFGYIIRSGLLKSIAEVSNGNYAFIPDAGMIGTVFVHAVAHLQSTYATRCTLEISAPEGILLKSTTGRSIWDQSGLWNSNKMTIQLGNLQYGQSRDIYLENIAGHGGQTRFQVQGESRMITAKFIYSTIQSHQNIVFVDQDVFETSPLPSSEIAYHQSRSMICALLSSPFRLYDTLEYDKPPCELIESFQVAFNNVLAAIPARAYEDRHNVSLMEDLGGQIKKALSRQDYFHRWGAHYFLSLWNAHAKQLCSSFKDPGPLMYNENPFFIKRRDILDKTFDLLPAPTPSIRRSAPNPSNGRFAPYSPYSANRGGVSSRPEPVSMSRFNRQTDSCFAASSPVILASGPTVPICKLRKGMMVVTPAGSRHVRAVLKTPVNGSMMCRVGQLVVTPWHPINTNQSEQEKFDRKGWVFPAYLGGVMETYSGTICSVLLEPDEDPDAHVIHVGGAWGVTLGHGVLTGNDARAHPFFGDYDAVSKEFSDSGPGDDGVYWGIETKRDAKTGLVCGLECLPSSDMSERGQALKSQIENSERLLLGSLDNPANPAQSGNGLSDNDPVAE
ncbi:U-box domain-containing protein [Xylaria scruposa]|nr:U-box domain-containing protein [Xylaria scruposa]